MPGTLMVITGYMSCNQPTAAVALLVLAMGFSGFQFAAHFVNHGDIAPSFAGTLFGISNVAATIPGILTPYVVGAVTTEVRLRQFNSTLNGQNKSLAVIKINNSYLFTQRPSNI